MNTGTFDQLEAAFKHQGADAAIERLCATLREEKDYAALFYALLLKKRHELGVSPLPSEPAGALPESAHAPYEEAIRAAARLVGDLYLQQGDIPRAWAYFRMLGEPDPVAQALEHHELKEGEEGQQVIEIAFHQGVNPRRGFDWILQRYGICSAITMVSGQEFAQSEVREYCIKGLVRALYEQLQERLSEDVGRRERTIPKKQSVAELIVGRDWLFEEDCYHVDVSHLAAVVQMSIHLPSGNELNMARELCAYGQRLSSRFQYPGEPPFEDQYRDYGIYLDALAGDRQEEGIAHFRAKAANTDREAAGTMPAEILVNLLVRLGRSTEALETARLHLTNGQDAQASCARIAALCKESKDYRTLVEVAREQQDPVHFMAGLLLGC
jgi:hypothetical protein